MNYKSLLVGMAIAIPMLITGCGSGVSSIAITTPPPAALEVNQSASIAATITGDSSASVDWTCTPAGTCGTFSEATTASGATTIYMAPRTSGPVSIIATSSKKSSVTKSASVTINPVAAASSLTGTYTFFANGTNESQSPYSVVGSVVINGGAGTVTSGEQDLFTIGPGNAFVPTLFLQDTITGGTITVGADGRGTLTLTPTSAPAETFSFTVVNTNHILITEFDSNVISATASGSMDLQTAHTSVPTNGNAFAVLDALDSLVIGGVFTSNGTTITAGQGDDDIASTVDKNFALTGSTFTAPDMVHGRGTITLVDPNLGPSVFAYYVVGPEVFRVIETDGVGFAAGSIYGQGTAAFSTASLGSKFVFGVSGVEAPGTGIGIYSAAGQFAGNGTSGFTSGVADINLGDGTPKTATSLTTGTTYTMAVNGYGGIALGATLDTDGLANFGVYMVDPALNIADPNSASGGGGAAMIELDASDLGTGIVVPQATSPTFTGNYAFNEEGHISTAQFTYYGFVGQVVSDGTSKVTGFADLNERQITLIPGATLAGTYAADGTNAGRSTMQLTINGAATANNLTLYQASSGLVLHVDVDSTANGVGTIGHGVFEQQQ
jgi:hypothetical protein